MTHDNDNDPLGWLYAFLAFGWWGLVFPLMLIRMNFITLDLVESKFAWSMEIMIHRVIWCTVSCLILVQFTGRWTALKNVLTDLQKMKLLTLTAALIGVNWLGFILAPTLGMLSDVSLGYYMNPLLNVLLGCLFLGERLRRLQGIAVAFAVMGVAWMIIIHGQVPWLSILVASTFATYGLIRKRMQLDALVGLTCEAMLCLPPILLYTAYQWQNGPPFMFGNNNSQLNILLICVGPATAAPLIWFAAATGRLRLGTVGFVQFITPTCHLIVAVLANNESIPLLKIGGFVFIWTGVAVYIWDQSLQMKSRANLVKQ